MRFGVLGPLAVWTAAGEQIEVSEPKVRALLADLLLHDGGPVSADRLVEDLWGPRPPAKAGNALQAKVSHLRRTLAAAGPEGRDLLTFGPAGYTLRIGAEALDSRRFAALAARARTAHAPRTRAELFTEALGLWRGPALADLRDESFAGPAVARWEEERITVLEERAEARLELGEHAALADELGDPAARHPLRERLRAAHMRALYRAGRQSEALESYRDLRERLAGELGIDPSPDLSALHQAILEQDPAMSAVAVPGPPPAAVPHDGLPAPLTELVGREADLDGVRSLLRGHRVVTLVGPGGVGKTRLAVAAASEDTGPSESVRFVELAGAEPPSREGPSTSAADLAVLVASAVGLRDESVRGPTAPERRDRTVERLGAALGERRLLIVLDNCEHVIDQAAELVERLLAGTPAVRILATGREPMGVAGEAVWAVPPLEVPRADASGPADLRGSAAARLFLARAAEAAPGFSPTDREAAAIAAICRRLDGLPLALELAASRVRAFGVRALAERLDDRFRMLSAGRRGAPPRQRTLRAAIDWSWELLDEAERTVLRRLAVHRDGCTLEAAEAVCSGGGVAAADVAAVVARLVDRSLVAPSRTAETRYGLLESVSAYCLERLEEAGESARLRRRHHIYYRDLAERADPLLRGPEQREWLARLDAESANLRAAVETAVRDGAAESARRITTALVWYWYLRGRRYEAARSLARALAVPGPAPEAVTARVRSSHAAMVMFSGEKRAEANDAALAPFDGSEDPAGRAMAQWFLAHAEFGFGDLAESERLLDEALAAFRRLGDRWGTAAALGIRASQAIFRGDLAAVRRHGRRSAELFTELGDDWGRLLAVGTVGTYYELTGDYPKSGECYLEGRRIAEDLELWPDLSTMLARHGRVALLEGDHTRAGALLERARRIAVEHADRPGEEFADVGLALSERRQGRLETAEARLRRWLEWNRQVEADYGLALLYAELGFIAELREDAAAAEELHRSGLAAARATGDPRAVALALEGLAGAQSLTGHHVRAARLLRSAGELRASSGAALPAEERGDVERIAARVRAALGETALPAEPREAGID